ncbi:MAG: lactate utilization protein [Deltaproteobacteria bacterium]|nr:MAG: lactate utilization protein [Deltaproteobacteria bacterium]HDG98808.1 lactate utilization protein [Desulfobacterales bacterium]
MKEAIDRYWKRRLEEVKESLEKNGFDCYVADDIEHAKTIVLDEILANLSIKSISWGGSMTFVSTGLYDTLVAHPDYEVVDTYQKDLGEEEKIELRRQSLMVDLFFTGTNAITEDGILVNLDMYGNRVAALTFGPKYVVVLSGKNKIVPELDDAMYRIRNYAAPINAMRLKKKTPCVETTRCQECNSPDRICNTWTITQKSFPKGRVKVVLINEDLGF